MLELWFQGKKPRVPLLAPLFSVSEKDAVMEDLCRQHTDEMKVLEGNVLTICGQQCTTEFQPSADQS